jgi:hypothetical protein
MRKASPILLAGSILMLSTSLGEAKSCSDVLNTCMKMYNVTRGRQGASDPVATCRADYNGCLSTGVWAGQTTTIKDLEKK